MRRIILILVIVAVLVAAVTGVWWYLRRNTGERLLARAELALRAQKYDRAIELSRAYAADNPDDWRPHYYQAQAHSALGRYDEALKALDDAAKVAPDHIEIALARAETFSRPARETLRSISLDPEGRIDPNLSTESIRRAIEQLDKAREAIQAITPADEQAKAFATEAAGLIEMHLGRAKHGLAERFKKDADIARQAGADALAEQKQSVANEAGQEADRHLRKATDLLLDVARYVVDTKPENTALRYARAMDALVQVVCLARNDAAAILEVRAAIEVMDDPPPMATARLVMDKVGMLKPNDETAPTEQELREACDRLDALLARHPDHPDALPVRIQRGRLALRLQDLDKVEEIASAILETLPQQPEARLYRALVTAERGNVLQAEKDLFALKTDFPGWASAHYEYARIALQTQKKELAREALRKIIGRIDPEHVPAGMLLAQSLLEDGYYKDALDEARLLRRDHRDNPSVLRLFARCAAQAGATQLALDALQEADEKYPDDAAMQAAIADGYDALGQKQTAGQTREKITQMTPTTLSERLAVSLGLIQTGRYAEAETLLGEAMKLHPRDPEIHFRLGRLFLGSGRVMQAIERLQEAVDLAPLQRDARLALAQALLRANLVEEADEQVAEILAHEPADADARLLANQIRILKGQPPETASILDGGLDTKSGRPLAQTLLARGDPQKCIEICQSLLQQDPDDADTLWLIGRAYLAMGETDKGIAQWSAAIKASPDNPSLYQGLASVLVQEKDIAGVQAALSVVPGANLDLVNMAVAWLLRNQGRYADAAEAYDRVVSGPGADESQRDAARIERAQCLAIAGDTGRASIELANLARNPLWRARAMLTNALILAETGQLANANAVLEELTRDTVAARSWNALAGVAAIYLRTNQFEKALAIADQAVGLFRTNPEPLLLQARALYHLDRGDDAIECLRRAVACQPGRFDLHIRLARALDATQKPKETLEALEALQQHGQAGRTVALYELAATFSQWGLQKQAIERLNELLKSDIIETPQLHITLGRALMALGETEKAREQFLAISPYSPDYVQAQQRLALLSKTDDEKLAVLQRAEQHKPSPTLRLQRIAILLQAGRADEAVQTYRDYEKTLKEGRLPLPALAMAGLQAMLRAGDLPGATDLASRIAQSTKDDHWRLMAIVLAMDSKPEIAREWLLTVDKAGPLDILLGLCLSQDSADRTAAWITRLEGIPAEAAAAKPPRRIAESYLVLGLVLAGRLDKAEELLNSDQDERQKHLPGIVRELVTSAKADPALRAEAVALAKATVAMDVGLSDLGRQWAFETLKRRPTSQWAARLATQDVKDMDRVREIRALLKPDDCVTAKFLDLDLLADEGKHDEAAAVAKALAMQYWNHSQLLMRQATATENAGRLDEALAIYQQVWEKSQDPLAGNNAAYLVTELHPDDTNRLRQALGWAEGAIQAQPAVGAFRDTAGWIAYLLGENDKALAQLRQAIKGFPDEPEIHYHLGMAERKAGNDQLARWHLEAAVAVADAAKAEGRELDKSAVDAVRHAQAALVELQGSQQP